MMKFNVPITSRLSIVKNIIALSLLTTVACTWPLWSNNRLFPVFPGSDVFPVLNIVMAYVLPVLLMLSTVFIFLFRKPRFFIVLASLLCVSLLLLDAGRSQYWFYFYLLLLLILGGYNWRVDRANEFSSYFNALKIMLAGVYAISALQHFQPDFFHTQWPAFIKPFERFWTPEQCAYLLKVAYVVPFIELFIIVGLFFNPTKIAAISFAVLFHLFSFVVLLLQPQTEAAVVIWHLTIMLLLIGVFAGKTGDQKNYGFSFGLYPAFIILIFGIALPLYFYSSDKPLRNKMDLMQSNAGNQYVYISAASKSKLPFYLQSFATSKENEFFKLSVTA